MAFTDNRTAPKMEAKGDREILEKGEARVLAQNYSNKDWLESALKVSEKTYGRGASLRIREYMRLIWKTELLK